MALSRISNGSRVGQLLSYNMCGCQQLSTKPSPESNNRNLDEFKAKVEQGPDFGDFIAGVVPREMHGDYEGKLILDKGEKRLRLYILHSR